MFVCLKDCGGKYMMYFCVYLKFFRAAYTTEYEKMLVLVKDIYIL